MKYILAFSSTHKVLKAEEVLKESRVRFRLDPAPKEMTRFCELVITLDEGELQGALGSLRSKDTSPGKVFRKVDDSFLEVDL